MSYDSRADGPRMNTADLWHNKSVQFPLSTDEHAAMARYLAGIKKQLQDVSDLFRTRYGKGSEITEESIRTLAAVCRLEYKFSTIDEATDEVTPQQLAAEGGSR